MIFQRGRERIVWILTLKRKRKERDLFEICIGIDCIKHFFPSCSRALKSRQYLLFAKSSLVFPCVEVEMAGVGVQQLGISCVTFYSTFTVSHSAVSTRWKWHNQGPAFFSFPTRINCLGFLLSCAACVVDDFVLPPNEVGY